MLTGNGFDRVYLANTATDLRKSIDGLSILVQESFKLDPFQPALFVFCNRRKDKIKVLFWNKNGFALYYKRLEKGVFDFPFGDGSSKAPKKITYGQLHWLLEGLQMPAEKPIPKVHERLII